MTKKKSQNHKREIYMPSDKEDAVITAAAEADSDNPPLTEEFTKGRRTAKDASKLAE